MQNVSVTNSFFSDLPRGMTFPTASGDNQFHEISNTVFVGASKKLNSYSIAEFSFSFGTGQTVILIFDSLKTNFLNWN